jgi:amino acid adenylation domain-containing protein
MQGFALSPQQRRLWRLQQGVEPSPYQVRCAARIPGDSDRRDIVAAIGKAVERYEILRTSFPVPTDMNLPLQVIAERAAPEVSEEDLKALAPDDQRSRLEELFRRPVRPWDFTSGPLLRATVCALSSRAHVLLLETPALVADESAMERLLGEISHGVDGAEEPVQYADLSHWLNEVLESEETRAGGEYWRGRDLSSLADVRLPLGRWPRHALDFQPGAVRWTLPAARAREIEDACRDLGVSSEVWLLALWLIFLARWTGDHRQVVGVTLSGRDYDELEGAVGAFARSLPLSLWVCPSEDLARLARRTADERRKLGEWQQYFSWEALSTEMANLPEAVPGVAYCPFGFELRPPPDSRLGLIYRDACFEPFLLKLRGEQRQDGGLDLVFHYTVGCLTAAETRRVAESFDALVRSAVESRGAAAFDLDLVGEAERRSLSVEVFSAPSPAAPTLHQAFERQVAARPGATAVRAEDAQLTYGELNARADRLAGHLRGLGAGPESRVALCLERSAEMVVAILAVLKAGAAYVPLEPSLPARRLLYVLEDSAARLLVSRRRLLWRMPELPARTVLLDDAGEVCRSTRFERGRTAGPGNLAYVIYTSGSTGRPKGVAIEHRQVLAYVDGVSDRIPIEPGLSFATVSTFAADLGLTSVFGSLLTGGVLQVVSQERATDPRSLAELFERHPVDLLKIVPSHLRALLEGERPERVLPRRFLVLGGERLEGDLVGTVAQLAPSCQVFNHYGPTESTIGVSAFPVNDPVDPRTPIVLGRALRHCEIHVLSERLREVPAGVVGELTIGGAGLGRGYFGAAALTAEKFVPRPRGERPGERLYKSGDLARRRTDGVIEYLGRADQQVKVAGFRIELGEVEATLREHSEVRQASATVKTSAAGSARLVAYVVPEDGAGAEPEDLRRFLKDRLPEFMVPTLFVRLRELPLSANGKVDRRALPEPEASPGISRRPAAALRTPVEEQLGSIWAELLGLSRVGPQDNFFDLGGHSLLAMQMSSRLREAFGLELPLGRVFDAATLEVLAREVEDALGSSTRRSRPPLEAASGQRDAPLSFAQERHWVLQRMNPASPLYNMPSALRVSGPLRIESLRASFREILRRHEVLRSAFLAVYGRPVQRVEAVPGFLGPLVDLQGLPTAVRLSAAQECVTRFGTWPFDLEHAPMFRLGLLRIAEDDHVMVIVLHHIVADRWTLELMMRELAALYQASIVGRPSPLPEPPLQYADFARWQRRWLRGEVLDEEVAFWRDELAGAPPVLELSIARPRPERLTERSRRVPLAFSRQISGDLRSLTRRCGATLFQTLLAVYQTLLYAYSGETDIVVGSPIASRTRTETEGLIGCFINALALRGRLDGNPTFEDLLKRLRRTLLQAYTHQDLPFERLVREVNPDRGGAASPIFQVVFTFANEPVEPAVIPGLTLSVWERKSTLEGKYDLILTLVDSEEGIRGFFAYNLDVFDPTSIRRLAETFELLLHRVVENPDLRLDDLARTVSEEDRRLRMSSAKNLVASRRGKLARAKARRKADRKAVMEIPT